MDTLALHANESFNCDEYVDKIVKGNIFINYLGLFLPKYFYRHDNRK